MIDEHQGRRHGKSRFNDNLTEAMLDAGKTVAYVGATGTMIKRRKKHLTSITFKRPART